MKECLKCKAPVPNRAIIDGKYYNLQRRKYCLVCSPFKQHNTRKIHIVNVILKTKQDRICVVCKKTYQGKTIYCASCQVGIRRIEMKQKCLDYLGRKCQECGYDKCPEAMVFHHKNPEEKEFQISGQVYKNFDELKKELGKCLLLCNRCHSELHWGERIHQHTMLDIVNNKKLK